MSLEEGLKVFNCSPDSEFACRAPIDPPLLLPLGRPPGSQDETNRYLSFIRHLNARFIIYADGSATAGTLNGGAEIAVTEEDPANPSTLLSKLRRGTHVTWSYDDEIAAMRMAPEWVLPSQATAVICTDSQSLLKAIRSGFSDTTDLRCMLDKRDCWQSGGGRKKKAEEEEEEEEEEEDVE